MRPISSQGQITVPKKALSAVGLDAANKVWVFADPERGRILLTHEPLVHDLLESTVKAASKRSG